MALLPAYGGNLCLEHDLDEVSTIAECREDLWGKLQNVDFMTVNEKRRSVGLAPIAGGDVLQQPAKA